MKDNTLEKSDFNLNKEYELFDVIYSLSKDVFDNEVKAWIVIGHVLVSSSDQRCFRTELCSYPISVFIQRNVYIQRENLRQFFISKDRNEVVKLKKELLNEAFEKQLNDLK